MGPPSVTSKGPESSGQGADPGGARLEEGGGGGAQGEGARGFVLIFGLGHTGLDPVGESAAVPAGALEGAGAKADKEAALAGEADEGGEVLIAVEAEVAPSGLVDGPDGGDGDGGEPGGDGGVEAGGPEGGRGARGVDGPAHEPPPLAADDEAAVVESDGGHAQRSASDAPARAR